MATTQPTGVRWAPTTANHDLHRELDMPQVAPLLDHDDIDAPAARLVVTPLARRTMAGIHRAAGPQALVLSWPGGATCLPVEYFEPGDFDVIVGHVAGCPIHADLRQLACYADRFAVLDVAHAGSRAHPVMRLRAAATAPADG
jgi:uncharacterized protein (DUF779 family)